MPQAPNVSLVPTAAPSTSGAPGVGLEVPVDAFGGAVGKALEGLGGAVEQGSDRIWQRAMDMQNLENETRAKDADAQYMIQSGKMHADFLNKEGLNAGPKALEDHINDLQKLRTDLRGNLNPMAAKMYDASSLSFMGRNIFNAAGHSGQQMKVAANNASSSRIDLAQTNMGDNPTDEISVQRSKRVIETEVDRQADLNGWSDDQRDATKADKVSQANAHRIVGLAKTNAIGAQTMLDNAVKSKAIKPQDAERVQGTVQNQYREQGSRIIADKVLADRRDGADGEDEKTEQDYVDAGLKEAEKMKTDDPLFKDFVRDRILTQYKKQKMIETDTDNQNTVTIGKAMLKANGEGMYPTSLEELKAIDPGVSSAWDGLGRSPGKQQQILSQLQRNASGASKVPITPENLTTFHQYKGMSFSPDDDTRAAFMAKDFASDPKMAISQKNALMNLQDQMRKQSQADPRVARALRILGPDMQAAGVDRKTPDDYHQFTGALADSLEQFQTDHPGKMPSTEEVRTLGAQIMQEQNNHWWQMHQSFYQMQAPDEVKEKLRSDPRWKSKGITPNDAMLDRIYRADIFRKRYGGSAKANTDETNFPPNAPQ
jgi:hypothetical protein